ncbi:unnamed protein product [Arabidopsis halleri]
MARDSVEESTCDLTPHPCGPMDMTGSVGPTCPCSLFNLKHSLPLSKKVSK